LNRHFHFMGIGGVSMQGLARWYLAEGMRVSGCDASDGPALAALRAAGVDVRLGHDPSHLDEDVDVLVTTMAVPRDHPEVLRARELGIEVRLRIELLADLFRRRDAIGITGTHGKSTTTGMVAALMLAAGADPSVQLGAALPGLTGNMRHGGSRFLVAEVDESDPGFADLTAHIAVVTNLEDDHVAGDFDERRNYHASLADLERATRRYAERAERVLYCADWPGLDALLGDHPRALRYGTALDADYRVEALALRAGGAEFALCLPDGRRAQVQLGVPGVHNVMNAAAALAAVDLAGVDVVAAAPALADFRGVGRRWQIWGEPHGAQVVDDYAHHPTEVHATLTAAQATGRRVRAVLQPHRWVRTARHWPALADAAALADEVLVLDVYAAGERAIAGVDVDRIVERVRAAGRHAERHTLASATAYLAATLEPGDLVVTLGAGDVWRVAEGVVAAAEAAAAATGVAAAALAPGRVDGGA
jgi:UDP-N-acetylmuramate--alanine ligase